jgi:hypothetical protein
MEMKMKVLFLYCKYLIKKKNEREIGPKSQNGN